MNRRSFLIPLAAALVVAPCSLAAEAATGSWETRVVQVPSAAMNREIAATVVVPSAYAKEPERRFPVIYMLHGAGDNHTAWADANHGNAGHLAERFGVILVCPDGGQSWWFDSDPQHQFFTFVGRELVAWADQNLRTIAKKEQRGIAGLSMGGHGALWVGLQNPDTFGAIGSMSGGVDLRPFAHDGNWGLRKMLGDDSPANAKTWEEHSVVPLAERLETARGGQLIMMDCGTEDFFLGVNRDLHRVLLEKKIRHIYTERPGVHDWVVWRVAVVPQMQAFADYFAGGKE
jgi:S-formylglutathione hydrolase FrmB